MTIEIPIATDRPLEHSPPDLFDDEWYAVLPSTEVSAKKPQRVQLHHQRLVLWRKQNGSVTALDDRCPHLGASLSAGRLLNDEIVCPYHGLRYNTEGNCTHIPGNPDKPEIPATLCTKSWHIEEADGWVFVLWRPHGDQRPLPTLQRHPDIATIPAWATTKCSARDWPVHYTRASENTLDSLHFFEVHRHSMPFGQNAENEIQVQSHRNSITNLTLKNGQQAGPTHALMYPNLWFQNWGKMGGVCIAIVPTGAQSSRIYIRSIFAVTRVPLLKQLINFSLHWLWVFALWQDSKVIFEQSPRTVDEAQDILIGYDKPIIAYRKLRRASQQRARQQQLTAREKAPEQNESIA